MGEGGRETLVKQVRKDVMDSERLGVAWTVPSPNHTLHRFPSIQTQIRVWSIHVGWTALQIILWC